MEKETMYAALVLEKQYRIEIYAELAEETVDEDYQLIQFPNMERFYSWYEEKNHSTILLTDYDSHNEEIEDFLNDNNQVEGLFLLHSDEMGADNPDLNFLLYDEDSIEDLPLLMKSKLDGIFLRSLNENDALDSNWHTEENSENDSAALMEFQEEAEEELRGLEQEQADFYFTEPAEAPEDNQDEEGDLPEEIENEAAREDASRPYMGAGPDKQPVEPAETLLPITTIKENPFQRRSFQIQKEMLSIKHIEGNKTIGVWSPLHRMGVTSFVMNFAFYLAENKVHTAVLEGLGPNYMLKDWLKRYTPLPQNWFSFAKALHTDERQGNTQWLYRNVKFLPADKDDYLLNWDTDSLETYMTTSKRMDVTLVDFPTGELTFHTMESLAFVDELWILFDDSIPELKSWKTYIDDLRTAFNIDVHLIANKTYPFSNNKHISKELNSELIVEIPAMAEETMKNYHQDKPLYFNSKAKAKLQKPYHQIATHLFGSSFEPFSPKKKSKFGYSFKLWENIEWLK